VSRKCTVCKHKERAAIDTALLAGAPFRDLAGQFGLSKTSLHRHKNEHLPRELTKAHEANQISSADELLRQVQALHAKAMAILNTAEKSGDLRTALAAVREARGNLELLARLLGELKETGPSIDARQQTIYVSDTTMREIRDYARTLVQRGEIPNSPPRHLEQGG